MVVVSWSHVLYCNDVYVAALHLPSQAWTSNQKKQQETAFVPSSSGLNGQGVLNSIGAVVEGNLFEGATGCDLPALDCHRPFLSDCDCDVRLKSSSGLLLCDL